MMSRIALGVLAAFVLYLVLVLAILIPAENACLRRGYREATVTGNLTAYCIKRVNQTDVVVPLDSLRRAK